MYYVKFYNKNKVFLTRVNFPDSLYYEKDIDCNGVCEFKMDARLPIIKNKDLDNPKNIIELYDVTDGIETLEYIGFLDDLEDEAAFVTFKFKHYFQKLLSRFVASKVFAGTDAGQAVFALLVDTNANEDTLIAAGIENITTTTNETIIYKDVLQSMLKIRETASGQIFLNNDFTLDYKTQIGTIKTKGMAGQIILKWDENNPTGNTIKDDWTLRTTAKELFNSVTGTTTGGGGLTSLQEDLISQGLYGLQEKAVAFNEATDQATLDAKTLAYVAEHAYPKFVPSVSVDNTKILFSSYDIGDIVTLEIKRGSVNFTGDYQIVKISITNNENDTKEIKLDLSESTLNNRPARNPDKVFDEIFTRLQNLELV